MKGFALNEQGDLMIENGAIQMVHGAELTTQNIKTVLGTQKGEWFLNWEEGIDHTEILGKRRFATQNSGLENQYIEEINKLKQENAENEAEEKALYDRLAKRLDGVD